MPWVDYSRYRAGSTTALPDLVDVVCFSGELVSLLGGAGCWMTRFAGDAVDSLREPVSAGRSTAGVAHGSLGIAACLVVG